MEVPIPANLRHDALRYCRVREASELPAQPTARRDSALNGMVNVALIGGSSPSTPALFRALRQLVLNDSVRLSLIGRDIKALEAVAAAGRALLDPSVARLETHALATASWPHALEGSDIVLLQIRVGGYEGRVFDETFPLEFGVWGDEGLGPGGLSAALRNWPVLRDYLDVIQRIAPNAHIVLLTSPVGVLTRLAIMNFPRLRISGICELPWTTILQICRDAHAQVDAIDFDYLGVNHLGWYSRVQENCRDLVHAFEQQRPSSAFPSNAVIHQYGGIPLKYVRLYYEPDVVVREQRERMERRGDVLRRYRNDALTAYGTSRIEEISEAIALRPADWYEFAVAPLIAARTGSHTATRFLFLTQQNQGYCADLATSDILEIPHRVDQTGKLARVRLRRSPPALIHDFIRGAVEYERSAATATSTRDLRLIAEALSWHPCRIPTKTAMAMAEVIKADADQQR